MLLCVWNENILSREHCDCGVAVFVHTDGVDDAAVSVLSVIQAAQVSDGLSCKLVLQDIKKCVIIILDKA